MTYIQINCRLRPVCHTHLGKLHQWDVGGLLLGVVALEKVYGRGSWHPSRSFRKAGGGEAKVSGVWWGQAGQGRAASLREGRGCYSEEHLEWLTCHCEGGERILTGRTMEVWNM